MPFERARPRDASRSPRRGCSSGTRSRRRAGDSAWIDFPGPPGTFPQLSFADVETRQLRPPTRARQGRRRRRDRAGAAATCTPRPAGDGDVRARDPGGGDRHRAATASRCTTRRLARRAARSLAARRRSRRWSRCASGPPSRCSRACSRAASFLVGAQLAFNDGTIVGIVPPLAAALDGAGGDACWSPTRRRSAGRPRCSTASSRRAGEPAHAPPARAAAARRGVLRSSPSGCALEAGARAAQRSSSRPSTRASTSAAPQPPPPDVVVVAIDDKTFDELPSPTFPFDRDAARAGDPQPDEGRREGDRLRRPVHRAERERPKRRQRADRGGARRAGNVVLVDDRDRRRRRRRSIFGGGEGLAYSRGDARRTRTSSTTPTAASAGCRSSCRTSTRFPIARRASRRGHADRAPAGRRAPGSTSPGPPDTMPYLSFVDVAQRQVPRVRRARQDRRRRRDRAVAAGPPPHVDHRRRADARPGDPGERDRRPRSTASRCAACRGGSNALLIVVARPSRRRSPRCGCGSACALGARRRRARRVRSSARRSRSTTTRSSPSSTRSSPASPAILATGAIHGLTVAFEREQARDAFARFVPEAVVDQVLADADGVRLGGVRGEATVMFSDLRGFTSLLPRRSSRSG